MKKIVCPVCGKGKLKEEFQICKVCGWAYDIIQYENPDDFAGWNGCSVNEYREAYKKMGDKFTVKAYEDTLT